MRQHSWLINRNGTWYLRAIVPQDLVATLGRREIWKSLGTQDRKKANIQIQVEATKVIENFESVRRRGDATATNVSEEEIVQQAKQMASDLDKSFSSPIPNFENNNPDSKPSVRRESASDFLDAVKNALNDHSLGFFEDEVDEFIAKRKLRIVKGSSEWNKLAYLMMRVARRHTERELENLKHEPPKYMDPYLDDAPGKLKTNSMTLESLIATYTKERSFNWTPKTSLYYRVCFELIQKHLGSNRRIDAISREDMREFRDLVRQLPPNHAKYRKNKTLSLEAAVELNKKMKGPILNIQTADRYVSVASSLFSFAQDENFLNSNPARRLTALSVSKGKLARQRRKSTNERRKFSPEELRTLFHSNIFWISVSNFPDAMGAIDRSIPRIPIE